jgi:hypothetical protein
LAVGNFGSYRNLGNYGTIKRDRIRNRHVL